MENVKWKMENGRWKMEDGKWKMENGKWKMENGKWTRRLTTNCYSLTKHSPWFVTPSAEMSTVVQTVLL